MTASTAVPTPLPCGEGSPSQECAAEEWPSDRSSSSRAGAASTPVVAFEPISVQEVYNLLIERRAAVHAELQELRVQGEPVNVPFDAVFLCELAGLVLDLETGLVAGIADDYVAPLPSLRARLQEQGFVFGKAPAGAALDAVSDTVSDTTSEAVSAAGNGAAKTRRPA